MSFIFKVLESVGSGFYGAAKEAPAKIGPAITNVHKSKFSPLTGVASYAGSAGSYVIGLAFFVFWCLIVYLFPFALSYFSKSWGNTARRWKKYAKQKEEDWYADHVEASYLTKIALYPFWLLLDIVSAVFIGVGKALIFLSTHLFQVVLLLILCVLGLVIEANYVSMFHAVNTTTIYGEEAVMQFQRLLEKLSSLWYIIIVPLNERWWYNFSILRITYRSIGNPDTAVLGRRLTTDDDNNGLLDTITDVVFGGVQIMYTVDKFQLLIFEIVMTIIGVIYQTVLSFLLSLAAKAVCAIAGVGSPDFCTIREIIGELLYKVLQLIYLIVNAIFFGGIGSPPRTGIECGAGSFTSLGEGFGEQCGSPAGIFGFEPAGSFFSGLSSSASSQRRVLSCSHEYDFFVERLDGRVIHKGKQMCPYTQKAKDPLKNAQQMHSLGIHTDCFDLCTDNVLFEVCHSPNGEHKVEKTGTCESKNKNKNEYTSGIKNETYDVIYRRRLEGAKSMLNLVDELRKGPHQFTLGDLDCDLSFPDTTIYHTAAKMFCIGGRIASRFDVQAMFQKYHSGRNLQTDDDEDTKKSLWSPDVISGIRRSLVNLQLHLLEVQHTTRMYQSAPNGRSRRLEDTFTRINNRDVDLNETRTHVERLLMPLEIRQRRSLVEETFGTCQGEDDYPCPGARGVFKCVKLEDRNTCPEIDLNQEGVSYFEKFNYYLFHLGLIRVDLMSYAKEFSDCYDIYDRNPSLLPFRSTKSAMDDAIAGDKILYCPGMSVPLDFKAVEIDRKGINRIASNLCDPGQETEYACSCRWYYDITTSLNSKVYSFESVQLRAIFVNTFISLQLIFQYALSHTLYGGTVDTVWVWFWTLPAMPDWDGRFIHVFGDFGLPPEVTIGRRFACAGLKLGSVFTTFVFILAVYLTYIVAREVIRVIFKHVGVVKEEVAKHKKAVKASKENRPLSLA
jgi:hypothetical protein